MPLPIYLAMTAAEFRKNPEISAKMAWMACHFSPYGTGLSNCPAELPEGSMLIVNDRTPIYGHDPQRIAHQLLDLTAQLGCSRVLLDLQRPADPLAKDVVQAVLQALPCPVGVSEGYAADLDCPIFLPPIPLLENPDNYLAPWRNREVWLELAWDAACYTVTKTGCETSPCPPLGAYPHEDGLLCCRYRIEIGNDRVFFHVRRNSNALIEKLKSMRNITCLVGLYQELG